MGDVAHAALHDRSRLALTLAGLCRDAAHVGDVRDALDHQHVAGRRQVMRLEFRHPVDVVARACERVDALKDVAHGERRADDGRAGDGRREHRGADDAARYAELVHGVGHDAGWIAERDQALDHALRRAWDGYELDLLGRDPTGQTLPFRNIHCRPPDLRAAASAHSTSMRRAKKECSAVAP